MMDLDVAVLGMNRSAMFMSAMILIRETSAACRFLGGGGLT
jgi:hypothetical protein